MPSTRGAYSHVVSRAFASFRVVGDSSSSGQRDFCAKFDSRQLHRKGAGQSHKPWPVFFSHQHPAIAFLPRSGNRVTEQVWTAIAAQAVDSGCGFVR
jgi:hypothetical protein